MPNSLKPVDRQELLDTADELFNGCDLELDGIDVPTELEFRYKPAHINSGRLLVSGMIPEDILIQARNEVGDKNIKKWLAENKEARQRNQPPLIRAMRGAVQGFRPNYKPPTEGDFTPAVYADDVIREKRSLNTTLEVSGQPKVSVSVEQWSFLGSITVRDRRYTLDPTARGLYIRKHDLTDDEIGYTNSAGYLLLHYLGGAYEDTYGHNTENSSIESPIPPFTESPAHPSVVMRNIMHTLIDRS